MDDPKLEYRPQPDRVPQVVALVFAGVCGLVGGPVVFLASGYGWALWLYLSLLVAVLATCVWGIANPTKE